MTSFLNKHQKTILIILLGLISIGAGWYIAVCTKYAPWGFSDSTTYLSAARNFASGRGLGTYNPDGSYTPLMIFAPFYSILLSLFAYFKADLVSAARAVDIACFSIFIASSGWLVYLITKSFWVALSMSLMVTTTQVLAVSFTSIMSDPLALTLGFSGFLLLVYALKVNSNKWLILSAVLSALALLTRYAFAAFPLAGVLCVHVLTDKPLRKRLPDLLKYGILSFAPMLTWMGLQFFSHSSFGARSYALHFSISQKITQFATQLYDVLKFWLPYRTNMIPGVRAEFFRPILLAVFSIVVLLGLFFSMRKEKNPDHEIAGKLVVGLTILAAAYLFVLFATYSVSTELISLNERMFSPLIPITYGLLLSCGLVISKKVHPKFSFPIISFIIAIFFLVYNFQPFQAYPKVVGDFPNGYTFPLWKENPILTGQVALSENKPLITNAPDILLFYTNRSAYTLSSNSSLIVNSPAGLENLLHEQCAVVVLFDPLNAQRFEQLPNPLTSTDVSTLQSQLGILYSSTNGLILADNKCSN